MQQQSFWLSKEVFIGLAFGLIVALPVVVFGGSKTVFVDQDASGTADGTAAHPYHSISQALDHVKGGTEVRVKNGTYKENITIPKNVKVMGDSEKRDKVIIKADNDDKPTVAMKDEAELSYVTVKGGRHGVRILSDAKAHLFNVVVKDSQRDGIHIDSAATNKRYRVLLDTVEITRNDRAGIFAEKRFIVLIDSFITLNKGDGMDLAMGTEAWLENNSFSGNRGSGAKLVLDGSEIWSKKNTIRNNGREGVEINSYGAAGNIGFKKATIIKNGRYGIARVARTVSGSNAFGGLIYGTGVNNNRIDQNASGSISGVVRGF
ncbi:MAG: right-handed parallel beta-helix repeat-containing protein [Candidatus Moraniibacteriota bacterium]